MDEHKKEDYKIEGIDKLAKNYAETWAKMIDILRKRNIDEEE